MHSNLLPRTGVTCKELLHATDWYPTILGLAGESESMSAMINENNFYHLAPIVSPASEN